MTLLSIQGLRATYGVVPAVDNVDLEVAQGEVVVVLGANGAGKTTIIKAILGIVSPRSGSICFDGTELVGLHPHAINRLGVAWVPEGRQLWHSLTVRDNLELALFNLGDALESQKRVSEMEEMFPILGARRNQLAGSLSGGEQQMVAIGRALISRPRLLLMDEPSLGLAPLIVSQVFEFIRQVHQSGMTVLLVEQNARKALQVANRAYLLEVGHVTGSGTVSEMERNEAVHEAFLT